MEITKRVKVLNRLGFHLRAVAEFVKTCSQFKCRVLVRNRRGEVNGKSLLNLMTLAASYGTELDLVFEGEDAKQALKAVESLFLNKFGEKE